MNRPILAWNLRLARENWELKRQVRFAEQAAAAHKDRARFLEDSLGQARRDCDLMVEMAKDPQVAREFLATQREIGELG